MTTSAADGPLAGKALVVVGGTTGLGLSAAKAIIRAGGKVVVVGRSQESADAALVELGENARAVVGDAVLPATVDEAIKTCQEAFGSFDALYHVAGGSGRKFGDGPLHQVTEAGWDKTLDLNLKSMFMSNRAALAYWMEQGTGGVILNMGSVLGYSPSPGFFTTHTYATAKAAIIGMTRSAAAYYAPHNIRLNVIAPALVETPMSGRAMTDDAIQAFIKTKQPLDGGRASHPTDLDDAAVFLLSDQSRLVTGQVLAVDGGWTVTEGQYGERG